MCVQRRTAYKRTKKKLTSKRNYEARKQVIFIMQELVFTGSFFYGKEKEYGRKSCDD